MPSDRDEINNLKGCNDKSARKMRLARVKTLRACVEELENMSERNFRQEEALQVLPSTCTALTTSVGVGTACEEAQATKEAACEVVEILCSPAP